jgi:formylglycine-generating enzyme required for sulfatase activity
MVYHPSGDEGGRTHRPGEGSMSKIFLSYRRQDSAYVAQFIYERLRAHFGADAIFMDIDAIPIGVDFREHITAAVDQCGLLLAVIGRNWAGETGAPRRIDDPRDFVRIEIEAALERNLPVVPILIDHAQMPCEADLPPSLALLAYRNALNLDPGRDFHHHVDRLIKGIERLLRQPHLATAAPPADRGKTLEPVPPLQEPRPPSRPMGRWTNSIGMKLKLIPAGEFLMGSPESDKDARGDEKPQHRVRITQPFYLGIHPVTRGQFRRFVEATRYQTEVEKDGKGGYGRDAVRDESVQDPKFSWRSVGFDQTDDHPVVNVSWNDASAFCDWLSQQEGQKYRLPTEAEWEYACRARTTTRFSFGNDETALGQYAWYSANSNSRTHPVGEKQPNAFGLYDMHGNVWEWCWDGYDRAYYKQSPAVDPPGPGPAAHRVFRGGSWHVASQRARSAYRAGARRSRGNSLGFRLARDQSDR